MPVLDMAYDPSGTLIATGSADRTVRVWDIPRGHCTHVFREHSDLVNLVKFHPDGKKLLLYSASEDMTICVYSLRQKKCIHRFTDHVNPPTGLAFTESCRLVVSVGRDKVLNLYGAEDNSLVKTVAVMDELESVQYSIQGLSLLARLAVSPWQICRIRE